MEVEVSLPDMPNSRYLRTVTVLDDTGSSYFELFLGDCLALGFDPRLTIPSEIFIGNTTLITANGEISVQCIKVGVQFIGPNGCRLGTVTTITAACSKHWTGDRSRCSGQALRGLFFTATAPWPIGQGALVVGTHKSPVMSSIQARPST